MRITPITHFINTKERLYQMLIIAGFIAGIIIRLFMLSYKGTFDMDAYFSWGNNTLYLGLNKAYHGIYFPLQYQIFSLESLLVSHIKVDYWIIYKAFNLLFDIGIFVLLLNILSKLKVNPLFTLLYWLHPWFFMVFSLGYIDFHFAFFVLFSVLLLLKMKKLNFIDYTIAGIPIGLAFLLKPQMQSLIAVLSFTAFIYFIKTKKINIFGLLVPSVIMFTGYSFYFLFHAHPIYFLAVSYLKISKVMPCVTADLMNFWYPIAYFLRPDQASQIYSVSDTIKVLPYISIRALAILLTTGSMFIYSYLASKQMKDKYSSAMFVSIFGFGFFALAFLMTSGHENHLFMASILFLILSFMTKRISFIISVHIALIIQCLNISLIYSQDPFSSWLRDILGGYKMETRFILALISFIALSNIFICFFIFVKTKTLSNEPTRN
jgi:hypothetical protein